MAFLRFVVTWEAVVHDGPGVYDQQYLDYLRSVVGKANEHGMSVLIDPHQDVSSGGAEATARPAGRWRLPGSTLPVWTRNRGCDRAPGHRRPSPAK